MLAYRAVFSLYRKWTTDHAIDMGPDGPENLPSSGRGRRERPATAIDVDARGLSDDRGFHRDRKGLNYGETVL